MPILLELARGPWPLVWPLRLPLVWPCWRRPSSVVLPEHHLDSADRRAHFLDVEAGQGAVNISHQPADEPRAVLALERDFRRVQTAEALGARPLGAAVRRHGAAEVRGER